MENMDQIIMVVRLKAKYIFEGLHENQRFDFSLRSPCERVVFFEP
jgi:hypothetical protein